MGLLKLLALPVTGPVAGARWAMRTVLEEAEAEYYNEAAIRQEMLDLESLRESGRIDDATFERASDALLARLLEAREYHQQSHG